MHSFIAKRFASVTFSFPKECAPWRSLCVDWWRSQRLQTELGQSKRSAAQRPFAQKPFTSLRRGHAERQHRLRPHQPLIAQHEGDRPHSGRPVRQPDRRQGKLGIYVIFPEPPISPRFLSRSSGRSSPTSTASTPPAATSVPLSCSWSASTCTTTRPQAASMCPVACSSISSPAPWTRSGLAPSVSSSDQTTSCSASPEQETTGPRAITQRVCLIANELN